MRPIVPGGSTGLLGSGPGATASPGVAEARGPPALDGVGSLSSCVSDAIVAFSAGVRVLAVTRGVAVPAAGRREGVLEAPVDALAVASGDPGRARVAEPIAASTGRSATVTRPVGWPSVGAGRGSPQPAVANSARQSKLKPVTSVRAFVILSLLGTRNPAEKWLP